MEVGEIAYTQPQALFFDKDQYPYLRRINPARKEPGGTIQMRVERIGPGAEDYLVYADEVCSYSWKQNPPDVRDSSNPTRLDELNVEMPMCHNLGVFEERRRVKEVTTS